MDLKAAAMVFFTIFFAELGDKTQLATLLFASDSSAGRMLVFLSASAALVLAAGLAVLAGGALSGHISDRLLRTIAGVGFLVIGVWTLLRY